MVAKVIPSEQLKGFEDWSLPDVSGAGGEEGDAGPLTAKQLEEIQKQAYAEGLEQGRRDGLKAGQQEIMGRVHELNNIMQTLARPLEQLDETVEQELVALVIAIARQLVRRELKTEPGEIIALVRETLPLLPLGANAVRLHLHPEDAKLVRETLSIKEDEPAWKIIEDPVITRGGCKVTTETSQIDATVENRIHAVISRLLGDERAGETDT